MEKRKQFNHVIIGSNGSGKTYLAMKIAAAYAKSYPNKRILFILSDDGEKKLANIKEITKDQLLSFTGIKKIIIDNQKDFEFIANTFKSYFDESKGVRVQREFNGLMVCDDLGGVMNRRPEEILRFFKKRRQPNIDFLFIFHGLRADVPPSFYTYVNHIILFRTSDNHEQTKKELPIHIRDEFERVYQYVQKKTLTHPHFCQEIVVNPLTI